MVHDEPVERPQPPRTRRTVIPVAFGLAAMLASLVGPEWIPGAVALVGPFVCGWLNPDEPVRAGLLTLLLPFLGAFVTVLVEEPSALGALLFAGVVAAGFSLIASHVGAGVQRRRAATVSKD